jgi:hypothetical protein
VTGAGLLVFCAEMARLGAVISAPDNWMPKCGGAEEGGYHVSAGANGYVLTYHEKDVVNVLSESPDQNVVMEQVFVEVTTNMAAERTGGSVSDSPLATPDYSAARMKAAAVDLQTRWSAVQEDLLGRLNPDWRARQAVRNAERLEGIKAFFAP